MKNINLYWLRNDLRLLDNQALSYAALKSDVAAIYIYDPKIIKSEDFSFFHLDFINDSLEELSNNFTVQGSALNIFHNEPIEVFREIAEIFKIKTVISYHDIRNYATYLRDHELSEYFASKNIQWKRFQNNGVIDGLKNRDGWSKHWNIEMNKNILKKPNISRFKKLGGTTGVMNYKTLGIQKYSYNKSFTGGESSALSRLNVFLKSKGQHYSKHISSPLSAAESCSRLSPYITYGNVSMRFVVSETRKRQDQLRQLKMKNGWLGSLSAFSSRLRWHCHFIQKLEMQPSLENENMVRSFDKIRTNFNTTFFDQWKAGKVGIPMVDACMRYLKTNGWINFRMRAMLVSFASYNLWLDWKKTSKYLAKYFIDYEPGIHYNQFQMQSGVTGINAVRIYNPIKQQQDQDPNGDFVRRWVPELENVPNDYLQYPHFMSSAFQKKSGCIIGTTYPEPIVDVRTSALYARKRIYEVKSTDEAKRQSRAAYLLHGSRKKSKK